MTNYDKLIRMRYLMNRLPMACLRIDRAKARAVNTTQSLSGMPGGGGGATSQVESGTLALIESREAKALIESELQALRDWLTPLIEPLPYPLQRTVMQLRYITGMRVNDIAWRLNYSRQHIYRVLKQSEKKI